MRLLFFLPVLLLGTIVYGQQTLRGSVLDADKKRPLPYASVFLNNSSIGTKSDEGGNFLLHIPQGRHELIISCIGYETQSHSILSTGNSDTLIIRLQPKTAELKNVMVEPFEKNGWQKWGQLFLEHFIGTSEEASQCRIKNTEAIKFRHSKKTNELKAIATETLIIENKALGYKIHYDLEGFSVNFSTRYLLYVGYPFFEPMKGTKRQEKKWDKARRNAYYGSMMHFMRSLYRNTISVEGFEVRALKKIPNTEKQRVKELYKHHAQKNMGQMGIYSAPLNDSTGYYKKVLSGPDYYDIAGKHLLTGDSIAFAVNPTTAGLEFNDYLMIVYKKNVAPAAYTKRFPDNGTAMMSQITFLEKEPLEIQSNGSYYNPVNLMSTGYWAWSEKIAMMLPFDYKPL